MSDRFRGHPGATALKQIRKANRRAATVSTPRPNLAPHGVGGGSQGFLGFRLFRRRLSSRFARVREENPRMITRLLFRLLAAGIPPQASSVALRPPTPEELSEHPV